MTEELERTKRALERGMETLRAVTQILPDDDDRHLFAKRALEDIAAILNPPIEMETVEVVRWAKMAPTADGWHGSTWNEAQALEWEKRNPGCKAVKMVGSFERPVKRPAVREVSVEGEIFHGGEFSMGRPFYNSPECHDKKGTLIFRYTE